MISALQRAIRGHYRCRGSRRKCRSPLDFASTYERASVTRRIATLRDGKRGSATVLGKQELEASLGRILQASPDLSSLSLTVREVLREAFSSESTVSLEAATHNPYPISLVPDSSADSLYSLIAALSIDPSGESVIDRWTESNLLPAMLRVSHIVDTYERLLDACVPETGYFNLVVKPRQERDAGEQLYARKKAKTGDATISISSSIAKDDKNTTNYNQSSKTAKSMHNSYGDRLAKTVILPQSRLPLAPKWPRR
ncbi:hypothetical protein FB107DRAFT_270939 [Schizophyllum commune]